jgi:hypothetical protein
MEYIKVDTKDEFSERIEEYKVRGCDKFIPVREVNPERVGYAVSKNGVDMYWITYPVVNKDEE